MCLLYHTTHAADSLVLQEAGETPFPAPPTVARALESLASVRDAGCPPAPQLTRELAALHAACEAAGLVLPPEVRRPLVTRLASVAEGVAESAVQCEMTRLGLRRLNWLVSPDVWRVLGAGREQG